MLLHKLGATVIALSRTQEDLDALRAEIPDVVAIKVDLENGAFIVERSRAPDARQWRRPASQSRRLVT